MSPGVTRSETGGSTHGRVEVLRAGVSPPCPVPTLCKACLTAVVSAPPNFSPSWGEKRTRPGDPLPEEEAMGRGRLEPEGPVRCERGEG